MPNHSIGCLKAAVRKKQNLKLFVKSLFAKLHLHPRKLVFANKLSTNELSLYF